MADDIVARLRDAYEAAWKKGDFDAAAVVVGEAADEIERLRTENSHLRETGFWVAVALTARCYEQPDIEDWATLTAWSKACDD